MGVEGSRIARLAADLETGGRTALDAFWRAVETTGAPLVEPVEGEPSWRLVTFVWRDRAGDAENVVVLWGPAPYWDVRSNVLRRLPGSDLWYKTYRVRSDHRGRYIFAQDDPLSPLPREGTEESWARYRTFVADPLNPRVHVVPRNALDPHGVDRRFSVLELPDAPPQRWAQPRHGVPRGRVEQYAVRSDVLGNERPVWVYTPPGYESARCHDLLVVLDGRHWVEQLPVAATLDNLLADGLIPPMVAVLPDSLSFETRSSELTCHEPFLEFLAAELLPWAGERWSVTDDPARRIVDGLSYGGLTALFAGLRRPDVFGNVIAHSPSLWWQPAGAGAEWLVDQYELSPPVPVRVYLEVGSHEGPAMVPVNRRLRDVLDRKGYDVDYVEYNGGHDLNCWRGGLADALRLLTARWRRARA